MYLSKRVKVVAGVSALLGLVMAGGAAFTAEGLVFNAGNPQFIGGTIVQNVVGTSVTDISFTYNNPTPGAGDDGNADVTAVTLTFGDANAVGAIPVISFTGDDPTVSGDQLFEYLAADWSCTAIAGNDDEAPYTSLCTVLSSGALAVAQGGQGYAEDVESVTVTVPGIDPS